MNAPQPFSFVHAGDLHLDSPFKGVTAQSPAVAEALRSATFDAFDALVQLCIDKGVRFLLVSGDVYNSTDRSLRAQLKFLDGLKRLADHDIHSFVAHGNHDPLDGWSSTMKWPEKVHIFGADHVETKIVPLEGEPFVSVSGVSYGKKNERRKLAQRFQARHPALFQIGVLHCNCGGDPNHEAYAPCSLEDLTRIGLDYWALGHIHEKKILHRNPYIVYPGNTQGLSIREPGERGCYLVTVHEGRHVDIVFCPPDRIRWLLAEIKIDDLDAIDGLDRAIGTTIDRLREEASGRSVICRVALTGRGPLYRELRRDTAIPDLLERGRELGLAEEPFVWVQALNMQCQPEIDLEARRDMNDLLGQVLCVSKEIQDLLHENGKDPQAREKVLRSVLRELFENRHTAKWVDALSPDMLETILHDAELLCVHLLEPEE